MSTHPLFAVLVVVLCIDRQEDDNDAVDGTSDGHPLRHTNGAAIPTAFALERHINIAIKMLELDPNLGKVHARLIAKMPEEMFWFHYFSRIETLREEVGLEPLCEDFAQVRASQVTSLSSVVSRV